MSDLVHFAGDACVQFPAGSAARFSDDPDSVTCPDCRRRNGWARTTLTDGTQVYPAHRELRPNGQQRDYVVLSESERAKGFVRPFRDAYRHQACGKITTMARSIAETYARDPSFYGGTFCTHCGAHCPVGEDGEFTWYEMDGREGPKVGT